MRKTALLAGAAALAVAGVARADVFGPGPGGAFPDATLSNTVGGQGVFTSTIVLPAGTGSVISLNNVTMVMGTGLGPTGAHTWAGDLSVSLTAPNGDNVHLFSRPGVTTATGFGNSADFTSGGSYVFVNSGGLAFPTASVPTPIPAGTYNRSTNIGPPVVTPQNTNDYTVFAGDPADGVWTLRVEDWAGGDTGGLVSWSLDITIPEPGSLGLLTAGLFIPLMRRRRR